MKPKVPFLALLALAVALAASAPPAAAADPAPETYLIVATQWFIPTDQPRPQTFFGDESLVILHNGSVFSSRTERSSDLIPRVETYQGQASAAQMQELRDRLNALKIRAFDGCTRPGSMTVKIDMTWYSALGRRGDIRFLGGPGVPSQPHCEAKDNAIFQAIALFEAQVLANPDTELRIFE